MLRSKFGLMVHHGVKRSRVKGYLPTNKGPPYAVEDVLLSATMGISYFPGSKRSKL